MAASTQLTETDTRWTLSNASLAIAIDKSTGTIVSLVDVADGFDACRPDEANTAMIGGLRIADELTGQTFCDLSTASTVTAVQAGPGPDESQQVVLDKQFDGAQFTVRVTYRLEAECLLWLAEVSKREGDDRSIRIVFIVPQPSRRLWGPMADPFVGVQPEQPIMIRHGLAHGRAVASQKRSVPVPLLSFIRRRPPNADKRVWSFEQRCMALALPMEVPNVLVRFMNNADETHLNLSNSLTYAPDQREYFKVCYDFLGLRRGKPARAGVLISAHDGQWRAALGWYAKRYAKYFQPDPRIHEHEGVYHGGRPDPDDEAEVREKMKGRHERGVRWAELHCHFPHYGLYVNPTEPWAGEHSGIETTYDLVRRTIDLYQEQGIKVHTYYNIIDGQRAYAESQFPESIVVDERGERVPAFRDCWLMNADPSTPFGRHCLEQFDKLLETYGQTDAIFFDVYGRHYNLDFGHDDGITMVHNRPAYCLKFAFARIMERIEPKLRAMGKQFSANKPEGIQALGGIDLIMADEGHDPYRLEAFSYYGLFKPVMVLDGGMWRDPEPTLKTCLRLGMMYNDFARGPDRAGVKLSPQEAERNRRVRDTYTPLLQELIGKQWVLEPNALELPEPVRGNIFQVPDGRVIVTMVSDDRSMFEDGGFASDVPVVVRFAGAQAIRRATVRSVDYDEVLEAPVTPDADTVTVTVPRHRTASIVILER